MSTFCDNSSSSSSSSGNIVISSDVTIPVWRRLPDIEPVPNETSRRRSRQSLSSAGGATFGEAGVILRTNPSYEHLLAVKLSRISTERSRALRTINANRQRFVDDQQRKRSRLTNVDQQLGGRVKGQVVRSDRNWTSSTEDEIGGDDLKIPAEDRTEANYRAAVIAMNIAGSNVEESGLDSSAQYSWQFGTGVHRKPDADS